MHWLFVLILFVLAFLERTVFNLGPNVELITAAMLTACAFLNRRQAFFLVLAVMAVTDLLLGNSLIFLFTWSGFLLPALILPRLLRRRSSLTLRATGLGLASNIFFFAWTNFGVWLLDSWQMYPDNLGGLMQSYIAGLPFLKHQLASTLLFVPLTFLVLYFIPRFIKIFSPRCQTNRIPI